MHDVARRVGGRNSHPESHRVLAVVHSIAAHEAAFNPATAGDLKRCVDRRRLPVKHRCPGRAGMRMALVSARWHVPNR